MHMMILPESVIVKNKSLMIPIMYWNVETCVPCVIMHELDYFFLNKKIVEPVELTKTECIKEYNII